MRSVTKVLAILAVAGLAFAGCKKEKKPTGGGNNPGPTTKITRIEENGLTTSTFEYNADGTLKKATSTISPGNSTTFNFKYDAQKRMSEFSSDMGYVSKFVYADGVLKMTENFEDGEKQSENMLTYENGKIKTNTLFVAFPQGGGNVTYKPTFRVVFTYFPNGNADKVEYFSVNPNTNQQTLEYGYRYKQYDDFKSPTSVLADFAQVLLYQPIHKNNPLLEEYFDGQGVVDESTTNVYTYDASTKLPLTCTSTVTPVGETPTVINVKFFY